MENQQVLQQPVRTDNRHAIRGLHVQRLQAGLLRGGARRIT